MPDQAGEERSPRQHAGQCIDGAGSWAILPAAASLISSIMHFLRLFATHPVFIHGDVACRIGLEGRPLANQRALVT